jgi:hypothetical protein
MKFPGSPDLLARIMGGAVHLNLRPGYATSRHDLMCQGDGGRYDSRLSLVTCGACLIMAEAALTAGVARFVATEDGREDHFEMFLDAFPVCTPPDHRPKCHGCGVDYDWRPTTKGRHGAKCLCGDWWPHPGNDRYRLTVLADPLLGKLRFRSDSAWA